MTRTVTTPSGEKMTVNVGFGVDFFRPFFWLQEKSNWWVLLFEYVITHRIPRFFNNASFFEEIFIG
jgi:hypothetical protein